MKNERVSSKSLSVMVLALLLLLGVALASAPAARVDAQSAPRPTAEELPADSSKPGLEGGGPASPIPFSRPQRPVRDGALFTSAPNAPAIAVWYGAAQTFGDDGDPQKWVNILGNVSSVLPISSFTYSLNGGPAQPISRGPDDQRLAQTGDFNIELDYTDLQPGANTLAINATDSGGGATQATVTVNYQAGPNWTPGNYTYDWGTASEVDDLVQVVDGSWEVNAGGARPLVFDYDRILAIGDLSWRDYTVTVPITVASIDDSGFFAPSNGPGVGVMVRWQGHYKDPGDTSPLTGWRRLGALGWYRWTKPDPQQPDIVSGFQLLGHTGIKLEEDSRPLITGTTYIYKLKVQSNVDPTKPATYSFKVWEEGQPEPANYDFVKPGRTGEPPSGSVVLIAHHVDATFGDVTVELASVQPKPTLTVSTVGTGSGQVTVNPDKTGYRFGEDVVLTAQPDAGSVFQGWKGDLTSTDNPATISMFRSQKVSAFFADPTVEVPVSDDFSGCVLDNKVWEFVNPLADATLTMTGTQAQIAIPAGVIHDVWSTGITAPHILQVAQDEDFEIVTKIDSTLSKKTQIQGILIQQDDSTFMRYNVWNDGNVTKLQAYTFVGSNNTKRYEQTLALTAPTWLRVGRVGDDWTLAYSTDGTTWQPAVAYTFDMTVTGVGLFAGNAGQKPATTAQFDYFFNTASPIDPEDGGTVRTLDVNVVGLGDVTVDPDKESYVCGEEVTLTAAAAPGWSFIGWSGALSGSEQTKTLVMNKPETVTATFAPTSNYTLQVNIAGSGTVTKNPDLPSYGANQQVQLTAVPAVGWSFAGWSGDLSGTANPATVTMTKNTVITATFEQADKRSLTVTTVGLGSVTADPDKPGGYDNGEVVTLTAVPAPGWSFAGWSGDASGSATPIQVVMDADKSVTATFALNVHALTVNVNGNGAVTRAPDKPLYYNGEVVALTPVPAPGYVFVGWGGDLSGAANPAQLTMNGPKTVTATFVEAAQFKLNLSSSGNGTAAADPAKSTYSFGDVVTLSATPDLGYAFIGWSGSLIGLENPAVITITEDVTITAGFGLDNQYSLVANSAGNGTVSVTPVDDLYPAGYPVTLRALPELGYRFVGWSGDLAGNTNPTDVVMDANKVITATFELAPPVTLTTTVKPPGTGSITVEPLKGQYLAGEVVTLTAKPIAGYAFAGWQGGAAGNTNPLELTLEADTEVIAAFSNSPYPLSDDFNTCEIDFGWGWEDPTGAADYVATGLGARITVPDGEDYNISVDGNFAARLMQPAPNTDFHYEVKFESTPSQQYQMQGILLENTADDYFYVEYLHDGTTLRLFASTIRNGTSWKRANLPLTLDGDLYLQVRRRNDTWRIYYGTDGQNWTQAASFKYIMPVNKAGVFAGSDSRKAGGQPGFTAVVDYFFNLKAPILDEDAEPPVINLSVVGEGSVQKTPNKPIYECGESVSLLAKPAKDWTFDGWSGGLTGSNPQRTVIFTGPLNATATFSKGIPVLKVLLPMVIR